MNGRQYHKEELIQSWKIQEDEGDITASSTAMEVNKEHSRNEPKNVDT